MDQPLDESRRRHAWAARSLVAGFGVSKLLALGGLGGGQAGERICGTAFGDVGDSLRV
jgi:hypothetical protein